MASVAIRDVRKAFGAIEVIHGVDVLIDDGEFVVLVGPSGCGKSTLLRMIAGLENITSGEIRIGERIVNKMPPKERDIAMVFQNYALYPHMTVAANMGFSLMLRSAPKSEIDRRVTGAADILGLGPLLERYPRQLSGGQRQRVAMGRAIVRDPRVFLFDEPLSNLDAKLRVAMRTEIKELHQRLKTTTVYVTHDQIEAMTLADRIVVMHDGRVEQIGAPLELYDRPQNLFVAGFIGSPAMNFLNGTIRANGALEFEGTSGVRLPLLAVPAGSDGHPVVYGIRPEHFVIAEDGAEAEVQVVEPTGSELQVAAKLGRDDIIAVFRERHDFKPGDKIRLKPDPRLAHLFDEPSGKRLKSLGADGAVEAGERRAAVHAAMEIFRAVRGRRLRGADRCLHQGDRREGQHLARILRGRAAESLGRRQYRRRTGSFLGTVLAAPPVSAEMRRRERCRRLPR
jgi:multiple sugar transport system ATP-binding protein